MIHTASMKLEFLEAVILCNKELYTYIHNSLKATDLQYVNKKGFGGDNSLNIDIFAENLFIKHLSKFGNIFSEECGFINNNKEYTIIIDPIDGSNNIASNLPYYGSSVALKYKDKIIAGFVTNLITSIITFRIDKEIEYYSILKNSLIKPLNFNNSKLGIFEKAYGHPKICEKLKIHNIKYRTLGAVALSLSDSINYEFVLFMGKIREFDIAASMYIINDLYTKIDDNYILVSRNEKKFNQILEIIKEI